MQDKTYQSGGPRIRPSWILALLLLVGVGLYFSLHHRSITVRTEQVTRQDLISAISTNGKVEPVQNFEAHAVASAVVRKVYVHEGQHVKKGDLLVQLDDAAAHAEAARAEAQLKAAVAEQSTLQAGGTRSDLLTLQDQIHRAQNEQAAAQVNLAAVEKLQQSGAASQGEVLAAQTKLNIANTTLANLQQRKTQPFTQQDEARVDANVAQARAALQASQEMLRNSEIRSSVDGTVYQVPVRMGGFLNGGDLIVQVADLSALQVRAFVDEPEIGKLRVGEPVNILWDALPTQSWKGEVKSVPQTVIPRGTRTVGEVLCTVSTGDQKLLPNVNVNVSIQVARASNVLTAPREAVHQDGKGRFVLVVRGDRLVRQDVQTGIASLTRIELKSGMSEGDRVAINALSGEPLNEGTHVKVAQ
jgi:HlyD family secretion protein